MALQCEDNTYRAVKHVLNVSSGSLEEEVHT